MTIIEAPYAVDLSRKATPLGEAMEKIKFELKGRRMSRDEVEGYGGIFKKLELPENGPHDVFHAARVLIAGGTLGRLLEKTGGKVDLKAIEIASVIHDSQRQKDDDRDLGHGFRAAKWAELNLKDQVDKISLLRTWILCTFHALPDCLKIMSKEMLNSSGLLELAIMKDADALDRHRNGGHLNESFLRLDASFILEEPAKELFERSEARRGESNDPLTIVLKEAMDIGLVIE